MVELSHQARIELWERYKDVLIQEELKACQVVKRALAEALNRYEENDGFAHAAKKIGGFIKWETESVRCSFDEQARKAVKDAAAEWRRFELEKRDERLKWLNKKEPHKIVHEDISVVPMGANNGYASIRLLLKFDLSLRIEFPDADYSEAVEMLKRAGWEIGKKLPGAVKAMNAALKLSVAEVAQALKIPTKYIEKTPKVRVSGTRHLDFKVSSARGENEYVIDILAAIANGEWGGLNVEDKKEAEEAGGVNPKTSQAQPAQRAAGNKMKVSIEIPEKIKHKITHDTLAKLEAKTRGIDSSITQLNIKFGNNLIRATKGTFYRGVVSGINSEGKKFKVAELRIRYKEGI